MSDEHSMIEPPNEGHSDPPNWRHWTWWLRPVVALPLMLAVLLLLSPFLVRAWHLSQVPDIADPFDVEAFLSETVDDKDNAFVDYHAARALFVSDSSLTDEERQQLEHGWEKASPAVRAWVDTNLPALNRWRIGTEKNDAIDGDLRKDPWLSLPDVAPALDFSRLAWLQGEREQSDGHMAEAWSWFRAAFRHSRHVAHRKDCIGRTLGCTLHSLTALRMARWASDLRSTRDDLQRALNQVDEDFRLTRPSSEMLKVTYVDLPKYAEMWKEHGMNPFATPDSWRDNLFVQYCRAQPEMTIRWNKLAIENWLCGSDQPRRLQRRVRIVNAPPVLDLVAPKSGVSGTQIRTMTAFADRAAGVTDFADTLDHIDTELARHEALRLTLACQLWFRRHGEFPVKLKDLVPDVLPELPVDPFGKAGEMFRYFHDGEAVVIYSLGLDERDDHGNVELTPGTGYLDIGYRLVPPRIREHASEQKPGSEP